MAQPLNAPLLGMAVYVDRTVYCHPAEKGKQLLLKEKVKVMGGTVVGDPNEADIILGHPGYTLLDRAYEYTRAVTVAYHYVEEHCGQSKPPSYMKYRTAEQPRADASAAAIPEVPVAPPPGAPNLHLESESDLEREQDEVERAVTAEPHTRRARKGVATQSGRRAAAPSEDASDEDSERERSAPSKRRDAARPPQTVAEGSCQEYSPAPESAPIPTFRVPQHQAFNHEEVREWACSFIRWATMYSPSRPDTRIIRTGAVQMSKIAKQLRISTFRNYVVKERSFCDRILQVIRIARVHAERNSVKEISEKEMNALISAARKTYASQYEHSLADLPKLPAAAAAPAPSSAKNATSLPDIPPPHIPSDLFREGSRSQRRNFTEEGHAYMRQIFRWLLLLHHPSLKWTQMTNDMAAASKFQVPKRAFEDYRKGQAKAAFNKIQKEYEADPAAFRIAYDSMLHETRPAADDSSLEGEPARKKRKIEQQRELESCSSRGNDSRAATRDTTRVPSPTYSNLSPTATMDEDEDEGSDYKG
ncbi:hypothetical protein AURDEDRAFT_159562 [Auricularia subglabra TFB-10046 SS5]|nr:hypothetical protein AURDEDRAFT_159562 [Auricularia subglabra TFB-10046 SS5]